MGSYAPQKTADWSQDYYEDCVAGFTKTAQRDPEAFAETADHVAASPQAFSDETRAAVEYVRRTLNLYR